MSKKIYLDYAATTPVDKEVLAEMMPYFCEKFGNAMSIHSFGQEALQAVDAARKKLADFFSCSPSEIIFTSGATESNNLAIKGVVRSYYAQKNECIRKPHLITSLFEHHCVLDSFRAMEKEGLAEVTYIRPDKNGLVQIGDVEKSVRHDTILISIMYVNNEIGTVQPIEKIGKLVKRANAARGADAFPLVFHTDATQAVNYFDCDVEKLGAHLLSMSAHKIYGPKGVGALYMKKGAPVKRMQDGGDQEYKMRAGTHNITGIVGLGKAVELMRKNKEKDGKKIRLLRDHLIEKILTEIPGSSLNGSKEKRSPNNANFSFDSVEGEGLLLSLDMEQIACSTGSACSSGALSASHVLLSIGLRPEQAHGSLRMTIGKYTTKSEIDVVVKKLGTIVNRLKKISGSVLKEYYAKQ